MTSVQKVIKQLAMALAILLSVSIIGGILAGLTGLSRILSGGNEEVVGDRQIYPIGGAVSSLSLTLSGAKLKIQTADAFSVESNHKYLSVGVENGQLRISETKQPFSFSSGGVTVVLNIPEGFVFDEATVETGAGRVEIDALSADRLRLSLGAGEATIHRLTAHSRAEIEGGAGKLTVDGGRLRNLNLDMGVGALSLTGRLEGQSTLDYGMGETVLTLVGDRKEYCIAVDKGIGEARIDGESVSDGSVYGAGENRIDIDGGIGSLRIAFSETAMSDAA